MTWMNLKITLLCEIIQATKIHTVWFYVHKILQNTNCITVTRDKSVVVWGVGAEDAGRGGAEEEGLPRGASGHDGYFHHLSCRNGFLNVDICKICQIVHFDIKSIILEQNSADRQIVRQTELGKEGPRCLGECLWRILWDPKLLKLMDPTDNFFLSLLILLMFIVC